MCLLSHTRVREPARKKHREKEGERERGEQPNRGERVARHTHGAREDRRPLCQDSARTYVRTEITYFQTESVSSMKPNERRTADGRQPRPSCQLIDRNTSINGPRARVHAIPSSFLRFFVSGRVAFRCVDRRWRWRSDRRGCGNFGIVRDWEEGKDRGGEDRAVRWKSLKLYYMDIRWFLDSVCEYCSEG